MKTKLIYILFAMAMVFMAYSCKKDDSNTSLETLPKLGVDTVGGVNSFTVQQSVQELVIDPKIVYDGDPKNLQYLWKIYGGASVGGKTIVDTVGTNKQLKTFVNRNPGSYTAQLQVTDLTTTLKVQMTFTVIVSAPRPYGWLVAYEKQTGGSTDVSLIRSNEFVSTVATEEVMKDIYSQVNGSGINGVPLRIANNGTLIITDKTGVKVNAPDYKKISDFSQLFVGGAPAPQPEGLLDRSIGIHLINNGDIYWGSTTVFIGKVTLDAKGFKALPIPIRIYAKNSGVFDDLNKRFFKMEQQTGQATTFPAPVTNAKFGINLNYINKNLLFVGDGSTQTGNFLHQYAFFRDLDGSKTWLYGLNFGAETDPGLCLIDLTPMPDINSARFFETGTLGAMAIYATDKKIYSFTFSNNDNVAKDNRLGFTAPGNEVITKISLFKAVGSGYTTATSKNNKILFVATWDEAAKNGKVYLLDVNPLSGAVAAAPLRTISGFGKIKDMILKPS
ncbi:PKD-like family lipoprotein [Pedobacter zeae]|uniref:PKD-like family protein n=1 Tax=Pedobacter zeae TaxID=1737356 RepID=A0A7W6P535_9SPHI|nr:PKD-like family lipoprotein [Pedobacter zeae]MBB4107378.1 hypothetical protein [Pedobacter zeae]GGH07558.1 hypothetical protein GCM10007422_24680 [Pedobacter zeae]